MGMTRFIRTVHLVLGMSALLLPRFSQAVEERSFWLHASLGLFTQRNYFGPEYPATPMPTRDEVRRAADLLTTRYAASRLYLIYHRELPIDDARTLFQWWRDACPPAVEVVPALVLRMYDKAATPVFTMAQVETFAEFMHDRLQARRLAIYDIASKRDQGDAMAVLARRFPQGLIRIGLQPDEKLDAVFAAGVADTWSGMCHGYRNVEDWQQPGFGASTLKTWVAARNAGVQPIAWNLVCVAWDYSVTERGAYPGYDDARKNMPLPTGRNRLAVHLMRKAATPSKLAGFSSDLYILHENSRAAEHDDRKGSFYECLKRGEDYRGCYAEPFHEIVSLFKEMRDASP